MKSDSDNEIPIASADEFAALRVKDINRVGAFLDWGISKDLLVPYGQMLGEMNVGDKIVVRVLLDEVSGRMIATPRLRPFLKKPNIADFPNGKKLDDCLVYEIGDFGVFVIVNNENSAMIHISEFRKLPEIGDKVSAFVREFRSDGKLTLTFTPMGTARRDFRDAILQDLEEAGGFLPFNDDSSPEEIYENFSVSKKSFKKLLGNLMKFGEITMDEKGIYRSK
jgi:predicted RNA-binding protein (virulence factor B family)